jgi:UDP-N-acetylmuramyl pentapeptide synthase
MHHLHQKLDPRNHDIQHFANSAELIEYLSTLKLKDFDIFAKGSNGSKIHEVVKFLKQEYKI